MPRILDRSREDSIAIDVCDLLDELGNVNPAENIPGLIKAIYKQAENLESDGYQALDEASDLLADGPVEGA
jgi:hypothetical protein